jgi:hypothetical protein
LEILMPHPNELPIPTRAETDMLGREILRVWAAGGQQHVSINTSLWDDPASWGIMLVDLARHVANAYSQSGRFDEQVALRRLKEGLDVEWMHPTDDVSGGTQDMTLKE